MGERGTVYFIGCGVLGHDIRHIAGQLDLSLEIEFLPGGLHNQPDVLRQKLQETIDEAASDDSCVRIIVGYGLCGNGTVGITAPRVPLVIPIVHDCISLFLGSDKAYREEFAKHPGTFYVTAGWSLEKDMLKEDKGDRVWFGSETMGCDEILDKYGSRKGEDIISFFSTWHENYQRAAFIDTGIEGGERHSESARRKAEKYDWKYQKIEGDLSLMTRMFTATKTDSQVLVVPPEHVTIYSATGNGLSAAPAKENVGPQLESRIVVLGDEKDTHLSVRFGLGIDAGGTYTDAVIYDLKQGVLKCKNKALTTKWDFSIGIDQAISELDDSILDKVGLVCVSTTLATNAIVEGEGQNPGLIYMAGKGGTSDLKISHSPSIQTSGHMSIDGRELEPIDPEEIRTAAETMTRHHGVTSFAVSGVAGAVNPSHELEIKEILEQETGMIVTCGHELSDMLNFVVRAQTAVLNTRIIPRMVKFFEELDQILEKSGITAPVMVVKGDGTLMSRAMARERPVETILSGPAASVAGARLLTGMKDAMVVDIGGTTTDMGHLSGGMVETCESGARVGSYSTHVKALNMRTTGLGGDSHIRWEKGEMAIGPQRVAPMVWLGERSPRGLGNALEFVEGWLKKTGRRELSQIVLVGLEGSFPFEPTVEESDLHDLLVKRPHSPEELAQILDLSTVPILAVRRLEESGLVQRCGLTPTDILHVNGSFERWNPDYAIQMIQILAFQSRKTPRAILNSVLDQFELKLARELLKTQLSQEVDVDESNGNALSTFLIERILSGEEVGVSLRARFEHPIVGIGAPAHHFLPNAGRRLNAKVVIPEDADVANALGAITSNVVIKREIAIRPDHNDRFYVEGAKGGKRFDNIRDAEEWAIEYLRDDVLTLGARAGTSQKAVEVEIRDEIVKAGNGTELFLERVLKATLSGSPDLAVEAGR